MAQFLYEDLSKQVVAALVKVHCVLGPGLLESAYEGALCIEYTNRGISVARQVEFPLLYEGKLAGKYVADLVVEEKIILELKSVHHLTAVMEAQLLNYLRISGIRVGYLVNFNGLSLERKRRVV